MHAPDEVLRVPSRPRQGRAAQYGVTTGEKCENIQCTQGTGRAGGTTDREGGGRGGADAVDVGIPKAISYCCRLSLRVEEASPNKFTIANSCPCIFQSELLVVVVQVTFFKL